jgi:hypothetical protein
MIPLVLPSAPKIWYVIPQLWVACLVFLLADFVIHTDM